MCCLYDIGARPDIGHVNGSYRIRVLYVQELRTGACGDPCLLEHGPHGPVTKEGAVFNKVLEGAHRVRSRFQLRIED